MFSPHFYFYFIVESLFEYARGIITNKSRNVFLVTRIDRGKVGKPGLGLLLGAHNFSLILDLANVHGYSSVKTDIDPNKAHLNERFAIKCFHHVISREIGFLVNLLICSLGTNLIN